MSPESLGTHIFNVETDVWSYGVLVWEFFHVVITRGISSYPNIDNNYLFYHLVNGNRLPKPQYCPKSIYVILMECGPEILNRDLLL
jgi:hypothetical protein